MYQDPAVGPCLACGRTTSRSMWLEQSEGWGEREEVTAGREQMGAGRAGPHWPQERLGPLPHGRWVAWRAVGRGGDET